MPLGLRNVINIPPGVNKEDNATTSFLYTDADKIRFYQGLPEKVGGWVNVIPTNNQSLSGVPRTIFSYIDSNNLEHVLIGTHTRLYSYENGGYYNITPLVTSTTAIPNSLITNYSNLNNATPISVVAGSKTVTVIIDPFLPPLIMVGDIIGISNVTVDIGGVPFATFNNLFSVSTVNNTSITFEISTAATSTASGGGGAFLATRCISVAQVAHNFLDGDRIKISGATAFGGFTAPDLNVEGIVRYLNANKYAYYLTQTNDIATSTVINGGGAGTTMQGQIDPGLCTVPSRFGFGGGNFGAGAFGVGTPFSGANPLMPRIWSMDRYGNTIILTPGDQTGVYQWSGDINVAPVLVSGAPAEVNYVFVAQVENQIVTFGAGDIPNRVYISDSSDITNWTTDATSLAFDRNIEGSGELISHSYVKGQYLLFSGNAVYIMKFVDKPDIWIITLLTEVDGLIAPNSVVELADVVAWQGQNNFYIYNGSVLSEIPTDTLLHWMIDNINWQYSYLCFARKVIEFNEIWWFFPKGSNTECDTYIIWNYEEGHFTNGTLSRTAAEKPLNLTREQYLANGSCTGTPATTLYQHEVGFADNGSNMTGSLTTNYTVLGEGDYIQQISAIIPSTYLLPIGIMNSGQQLYSLTVNTKEYDGQLNPRVFGTYNITSTTQKIDTRICGRQRQYIYNFSNQTGFRIQKTYEMYKPYTVR